jgi:hypothetical protein
MTEYELVVHGEAVRLLLACTADRRRRLITALEALAMDPFQSSDFQVRDATLREQQVKLVHGMLVTYYADHAVKELRVTEIENL